jgi:YidC/Oxa1 family membrane protein insertase
MTISPSFGAENSFVHAIGQIFQPLLDLFGAILAFFYAIIPNYPIDVALLTIVIMAVLTPLTVKSTKNMAAMQALAPEMKKLQQKYKGAENRAQMNEEMMKLYKEHNVNPASGCLPMLLQMPAFFVLYSVIRGMTNTVSKGASIPYTVTATGIDPTKPSHCTTTVCAVPRYINPDTKIYHDIVAAHGQLISFGMNFAEKLLSHHSSIWVAIPYLVLVLGAVGLQYLQMSRLNARNPQAAQANPQAAAMQKYMPLIFGLIYLNVAAIINVYFIVSSAIRIGTQEVLFRKGIVAGPPPAPAGGKPTERAGPKTPSADRTEKQLPKPARPNRPSSARGGANGSTGSGQEQESRANGAKANGPAARGPQRSGSGGSANGRKNPTAGGGAQDAASKAKEHSRSKSKRARKAR